MGDLWVSSTNLRGLLYGSARKEKFSGIRCAAQIVGRSIGATTKRLCGSKESLGFSLNYGFRRGVEVFN